MNLIYIIFICLLPLIMGEEVPPQPCDSNHNKKDCGNDSTCAWCLDGDKCVNWNPCTNTADDCSSNSTILTHDQSNNRKTQCTVNQVFGWTLVILIFGCLLGCIISCCIVGTLMVRARLISSPSTSSSLHSIPPTSSTSHVIHQNYNTIPTTSTHVQSA